VVGSTEQSKTKHPNDTGVWFAASYYRGNIYPVQDVLTRLAADPAKVASELGHLTGHCIFCETPLNDPRSTAVGYGPICAKKFHLPWDAAKDARKAAAAAPAAEPKPTVAELAALAQTINATHDGEFLAAFRVDPLQAFLADGATRVKEEPIRVTGGFSAAKAGYDKLRFATKEEMDLW
jgi:hypothetical protein